MHGFTFSPALSRQNIDGAMWYRISGFCLWTHYQRNHRQYWLWGLHQVGCRLSLKELNITSVIIHVKWLVFALCQFISKIFEFSLCVGCRSFVIQQIPSSNLFMVVVDKKCDCTKTPPVTMDPIEIIYIFFRRNWNIWHVETVSEVFGFTLDSIMCVLNL